MLFRQTWCSKYFIANFFNFAAFSSMLFNLIIPFSFGAFLFHFPPFCVPLPLTSSEYSPKILKYNLSTDSVNAVKTTFSMQ